MNRRRATINGVINSPNPAGPVDHAVPVLSVETPDGELRAVLMGYACHNTTMAFDKFYGDYAGCAQQYLEEAHSGITALFLSGCGGDQNPYPRRRVELAEQHGRALANAVEAALEVVGPRRIDGPLAVGEAEIALPFATLPSRAQLHGLQQADNAYDRRRATGLLERLERRGELAESYSFPLQVAQFGTDLTLVTLAGEPVVDYSLQLKADLAGENPVWVAGYCHDVFGYLPTRQMLLEGGYEGSESVRYSLLPDALDLTVEKKVISRARELVQSLRRSVK
jgi:hypothetical protein